MAHISQNGGAALHGSVEGSSGATYFLTTDKNGVISCTCHDWMHGKTARGTPIAERVCKHIRNVLSGADTLKPIGNVPTGAATTKGVAPVLKTGQRKLGIRAKEE